MSTTCTLTTQRLTMFLIALATISCDSLSEDQISPDKQLTFGETHFYTVPGSSLLIEAASLIDESFVNATLQISTAPSKGTLSQVDKDLMKYQPNVDFLSGTDEFVLSVWIEGTNRHSDTINITMMSDVEDLPCGLYAIADSAEVAAGISVEVPALENDGLCAAAIAALELSIHSAPAYGEASVTGDVITYTPGSTFAGSDEFIYKLTSGEHWKSYAVVKIVADWTIEKMELPEECYEVYFVDEMTGFVTSGFKTYKTTNGGKSWTQLTVPVNGFIPEYHFLNADLGYAVYLECENYDPPNCDTQRRSGLLKTSDGGESWNAIKAFDEKVVSVFFTSATTGYISTVGQPAMIYKTEDGGEHWDQVLISEKALMFDIEFVNNNIGYAWGAQVIYITMNAGQSWQEVTPDNPDYLYLCLQYTQDFAFTCILPGFGIPSSILRSTHGGNWQPVINVPYYGVNLGFSPSGNLGISVGFREEEFLRIARTTDQGKTWIMETKEAPAIQGGIQVSVPSDRVAYLLNYTKLYRYSYNN